MFAIREENGILQPLSAPWSARTTLGFDDAAGARYQNGELWKKDWKNVGSEAAYERH